MEAVGIALVLAGSLVFLAGLISVVVPLRFLKIASRGRGALVALAGAVIVMIGGGVGAIGHDKGAAASTDAPKAVAAQPAPPPRPETPLPEDEKAFLAVVAEAREAYRGAANDMAKGAVRVARKAKLCPFLAKGAKDWVGSIAKLDSSSKGLGVLTLTLARDVSVGTWNNDLSDIMDHTLLDPSSSVAHAAMAMAKGDKVVFSGRFIQSDEDCLRETSLTQDGSLRDPAFVLLFSAVRKP